MSKTLTTDNVFDKINIYYKKSGGDTIFRLKHNSHPKFSSFVARNYNEIVGKYNEYVVESKKRDGQKLYRPVFYIKKKFWDEFKSELGLGKDQVMIKLYHQASNHFVCSFVGERELSFDEDFSKNAFELQNHGKTISATFDQLVKTDFMKEVFEAYTSTIIRDNKYCSPAQADSGYATTFFGLGSSYKIGVSLTSYLEFAEKFGFGIDLDNDRFSRNEIKIRMLGLSSYDNTMFVIVIVQKPEHLEDKKFCNYV